MIITLNDVIQYVSLHTQPNVRMLKISQQKIIVSFTQADYCYEDLSSTQ